MLISFKVYCDDMEQAIEKTVAYAEANGYNGLLLDVGEMNERAKEDLAYEKATETLSDDDRAKMGYDDIVNAGMPIIDKMEDETPDEYYDAIDDNLSDLIYIDATMEGADQCYYIFSEVQAEEFDDNKINESLKSNYEKGKEYLEKVAKEDGAKYYEIVEDTYEYPNGLMLIEYDDEAHEVEKQHICIDLDNLDKDEKLLGPSDETIAKSKEKGLYTETISQDAQNEIYEADDFSALLDILDNMLQTNKVEKARNLVAHTLTHISDDEEDEVLEEIKGEVVSILSE